MYLHAGQTDYKGRPIADVTYKTFEAAFLWFSENRPGERLVRLSDGWEYSLTQSCFVLPVRLTIILKSA